MVPLFRACEAPTSLLEASPFKRLSVPCVTNNSTFLLGEENLPSSPSPRIIQQSPRDRGVILRTADQFGRWVAGECPFSDFDTAVELNTVETSREPSTVEPSGEPSTVKPSREPSTVEPSHEPSTVEPSPESSVKLSPEPSPASSSLVELSDDPKTSDCKIKSTDSKTRSTDSKMPELQSTLSSLKMFKIEAGRPIVILPGGGVYFFWKAGFCMYLKHHFDISRCVFVGVSAGALAAFVTLCSEDIGYACRALLRFGHREGVFNSVFYIAGLIKRIADEWLPKTTSKNLDVSKLKNRLAVLACRAQFPFNLDAFVDFASYADLWECVYASAHIPLYANKKLSTTCRGRAYWDGSFSKQNIYHFINEGLVENCICVDYIDSNNKKPSRLKCIERLPPNELLNMVHEGYEAAARLHENYYSYSSDELKPIIHYEKAEPRTFDSNANPYLLWENWEKSEYDDHPDCSIEKFLNLKDDAVEQV